MIILIGCKFDCLLSNYSIKLSNHEETMDKIQKRIHPNSWSIFNTYGMSTNERKGNR